MKPKIRYSYYELFLEFFIIGLTAFGGLAMTAHIRKHIVDKKEWLDGHTFDTGLALCQIIPGAIVMQLAAYIGLKLKGIRGAIVCFIGFGLPAFLIMLALSILYKHAKNISFVDAILESLRVVIVPIVANAAYIFGSKNFRNVNDVLIAVIAAGLFLTKLHPVAVLTIGAILGLFLSQHKDRPPQSTGRTRTFRVFLIGLGVVAVSSGILFLINKDYFTLATIMLRIDLFSFGGGLAAVPIMFHELVDIYAWFDHKTFLDGIILGQITPGSIIIAATFVGYMHFGLVGSIIATVCVFTPSFLILMGIVPFFDKLRRYKQFNKIINGILCSFVGFLSVIAYHFGRDIQWNPLNIFVAIAAFVLLVRNINIIWIILGGVGLAVIKMLVI
ncbi:MAG: chromate efflux transporter [Bacteroidota bacterium]|nr:chromate efflux transporter [Bacteroidota bacterium]